jgi:hypothetical protein
MVNPRIRHIEIEGSGDQIQRADDDQVHFGTVSIPVSIRENRMLSSAVGDFRLDQRAAELPCRG